jgi:hypothetical protein
MRLTFWLLPLLLLYGIVVLPGCSEKEQTALLQAHGSGTLRERMGTVTYTDQSGQTVTTPERLLPWVTEYKVTKGQTISVSVRGYSPMRNYTVQIGVGHNADDRVTVASQHGPGGQEVRCSYTIGSSAGNDAHVSNDVGVSNGFDPG